MEFPLLFEISISYLKVILLFKRWLYFMKSFSLNSIANVRKNITVTAINVRKVCTQWFWDTTSDLHFFLNVIRNAVAEE